MSQEQPSKEKVIEPKEVEEQYRRLLELRDRFLGKAGLEKGYDILVEKSREIAKKFGAGENNENYQKALETLQTVISYHILIGSTPNNQFHKIKKIDFDGESSVEEFLRKKLQ